MVIFGDDDFTQVDTAPHRLVSLVARGLEEAGCAVTLSCDDPQRRRSLVSRAVRSLRRVAVLPPCDVVLYYGQSAPTLLALALRCWSRPMVPYLVEWPAAVPGRSRLSDLNAQIYCRLVFRMAQGAVVISQFLEDLALRRRPGLSVLRVPVLCDPDDAAATTPSSNSAVPQVTYCADLNGYIADALLVVESVAAVRRDIDLVLIGRADASTLSRLEERAERAGMSRLPRVLSGLPRDALNAQYARSSALMLPLDDSDRSRARYPSKLADYLMSGCPVVAAVVGEPGALLSDGETAYLVVGSTPSAYAAGIERALDDPSAKQVGINGQTLAKANLDYEQHGQRLAQFLEAVGRHRRREDRS